MGTWVLVFYRRGAEVAEGRGAGVGWGRLLVFSVQFSGELGLRGREMGGTCKMKLGFLVLFFMLMNGYGQNRIEDFRWKKRLLIVSGADGKFLGKAAEEKAGLDERDMRVFVLAGEGGEAFPVGKELRAELLKRLKPAADGKEVWLIGKDGRTSIRWDLADFTFEKVFAAIDAMPMRRQEMRD